MQKKKNIFFLKKSQTKYVCVWVSGCVSVGVCVGAWFRVSAWRVGVGCLGFFFPFFFFKNYYFFKKKFLFFKKFFTKISKSLKSLKGFFLKKNFPKTRGGVFSF